MADTVLIIDDEETLRFSFKNFLEQDGYGVLTAADISAALEILSTDSIDVVFCDILMPEGTGIDVLREVRKRGLHCPVVMVTGEPSIDTASEAVRLGAFDYLPKPVRRDMLLHVCGQALRHKALLDENKRIEHEREKLVVRLQDEIAKVKTLQGLLPICASCKKIRNDEGYWERIEEYIKQRSDVDFSHSICPECMKKLYPDYFKAK